MPPVKEEFVSKLIDGKAIAAEINRENADANRDGEVNELDLLWIMRKLTKGNTLKK